MYCANDHPVEGWQPPRFTPPLQGPCIEVDLLGDVQRFLVADYDDLQRPAWRFRNSWPLWAGVVPAVEHLTDEPATYKARIIDREAYDAQMRVLAGIA